jgi:hypothetical protein
MLSQTIFARALILSAAALSGESKVLILSVETAERTLKVCAGTIGNLVSRQLSPPPNVPEQVRTKQLPHFFSQF